MRSPMRRRHSDAPNRTKLVVLWAIIGATSAGFALAGVMNIMAPPDGFTLCERGDAATSTLILVDTSDALTEIQRRRVKAAVEAERDLLRAGGKLTILGINPESPGEPLEIMSACSPGRPTDANPLFVTRSMVEKQWAAAFAEPTAQAITTATAAPPSDSSPLLQTIGAALTRPDFDARVRDRRLVIISDMLEHEGSYSQLEGGDFWRNFERSGLAATLALDLRGVSVSVDYLLRDKYVRVQGERHRAFWQRLFSEAGARDVAFIGMLPPASESNVADPPATPGQLGDG